jgi:hypothetical protein
MAKYSQNHATAWKVHHTSHAWQSNTQVSSSSAPKYSSAATLTHLPTQLSTMTCPLAHQRMNLELNLVNGGRICLYQHERAVHRTSKLCSDDVGLPAKSACTVHEEGQLPKDGFILPPYDGLLVLSNDAWI